MMKKYFPLLGLLILLSSCDTIDQPLKNEYGFMELSDSTNKVVLIEEFTGADCNNCPPAAQRIQEYIENYPGRVVTIAIHESNFAVPDAQHPTDYRVEEGTILYKFFNPIGVPSAMFDRRDYPDQDHSKLTGDWDNTINAALSQEARLEITSTFEYFPDKNQFSLRANVRALEDVDNADLYLSAFLIEDSIISPQTMPNGSIKEDYVHMHMLRAGFNGTWGTSISSELLPEDEILSRSFSLDIEPEWKTENCSAVVFVYDRNTYEVLQAHHAHLED